jgi:phosphatidylglycerol:prolipoprotein diacylglycerol transferase
VQKVAFHLGDLTIAWYGVFVALGFLVGFWTASRRARLARISPEQVLDLGPWLIVGSILGARALYVLSYWREEFAKDPLEIIMIHHGGLVYYGGLLGASLAFIIYAKWKRLPLWSLADVLAPSIALGYAFGRIGCLMNGCCYGRECSLPWAIHFPEGHPTYPHGVHPTEIYDSLLSLGLYAFLAWLFRRRHFDGQVFATYLVIYAVLRSLVESFRGDYPVRYLGGWATPAQLVSLFILAAGVLLFRFLPRSREAQKK